MHPIEWLRASIIRQYFVVFAVIGLLAVCSAAPALFLIGQSTGSGGAINVSGSLRMQSYKLALSVANAFTSDEERKARTLVAIEEFGQKLHSPGLLRGVPHEEDDAAYTQYLALLERFEQKVKPLAEASITQPEARERFTEQIPAFVDAVDAFVQTLENDLNGRLALLQVLLVGILLGAIGVSFVMLALMRKSIFKPLLEIGAVADAVRQGNFSVRAEVPAPNEIGRLCMSFNFMLHELEHLYGHLEQEVEKKTLDLHRRNAGLQFLTRVAQSGVWGSVFKHHALDDILKDASEQLGARALRLVVAIDGVSVVLSESRDWETLENSTGAPPEVMRFALSNTNGSRGTLEALFDAVPEAWQRSFGEALVQTIGQGIEHCSRQSNDRRLAVLEERSTIARELHDSIAQSLSYSRIQMHRLRVFIERGESQEKILATTKELAEGISEAYSQLREVLTTFRLQINSAGLNGAIEETVEEFRNRTGIETTVSNEVLGLELNANAQVHFVHILREALVNIEKHAKASRVLVTLTRGTEGDVVLKVRDNGVGIPAHAERHKHFGLSIMRERAEALHGHLRVLPAEGGGTCVTLTMREVE